MQLIYGWDRTSEYTSAAGSRYQSISDLTQYMNEMRPNHNTGSSMPYSLRIVFGLWDGAYSLKSLSEKTWKS